VFAVTYTLSSSRVMAGQGLAVLQIRLLTLCLSFALISLIVQADNFAGLLVTSWTP
jgi:hypothetical protein